MRRLAGEAHGPLGVGRRAFELAGGSGEAEGGPPITMSRRASSLIDQTVGSGVCHGSRASPANRQSVTAAA